MTEPVRLSNPGAGSVYHGQIPFADLTLDTNSDSVPDSLEAAVNGSVTKFLANYSYANTTQFLIDSNDYYLLDSDDKTLEV